MPDVTLNFYLAAIPAVILLGLSKGGFSGVSLLSLPLMALVMSPIRAAGIMLPILIVQDAVTVWAYRRSWDAFNLWVLLPGAVAGIVLGYFFAAHVSDSLISLLVGLIAAGFAIRRLFADRHGTAQGTRYSRPIGFVCGIAAGFTSLIANAGAPPFQIYVLPQKLKPAVLVGTSAIFFAVCNWLKVAPFFALGQFTTSNLALSATLMPLAIAANMAGIHLVRRLSIERFYKIIYILLAVVSLKLIWDGRLAFFFG